MATTDTNTSPKRNIVLLIADDLALSLLTPYGGPPTLTPNLTSFSKSTSTTLFSHAYTSTASCSGSRTVLNTGLHTHQNGSYGLVGGRQGFGTFENVETAPELMNRLGYRTGIIGKVHVGPEPVFPWQVRLESETRDVAKIADQVGEFVGGAKNDQTPFYLTVGFIDPHRELFTRGGFGNPGTSTGKAEGEVHGAYDARIEDRVFSMEEVVVPSWMTDCEDVRRELAEYYRSIYRMDQGVGMILRQLEEHGVADDTMVLFVSDNGPPFVNSKTTLYEPGIHLPFLLRAPGYKGGRDEDHLISFIDVLPTFLDWAGGLDLTPKKDAVGPRKGRSLLPLLGKTVAGEKVDGWDHVFGSHTFHEVTNFWPTRYLRTKRFKYHRNVCWKLDFPFAMDLYASLSFGAMRNRVEDSGADGEAGKAMLGRRSLQSYIQRPAEELYDLDSDPDELVNLATDPAHQELLTEMRGQLETWQLETGDLWLWRDGTPVILYRGSGYAREGLRIPDRWEMDLERPGTEGKCVDLS